MSVYSSKYMQNMLIRKTMVYVSCHDDRNTLSKDTVH